MPPCPSAYYQFLFSNAWGPFGEAVRNSCAPINLLHVARCSSIQATVTPFTQTAAFLHATAVPPHHSLWHAAMSTEQAGMAKPKHGLAWGPRLPWCNLNVYNSDVQHIYVSGTNAMGSRFVCSGGKDLFSHYSNLQMLPRPDVAGCGTLGDAHQYCWSLVKFTHRSKRAPQH